MTMRVAFVSSLFFSFSATGKQGGRVYLISHAALVPYYNIARSCSFYWPVKVTNFITIYFSKVK